MSRPLRSLLPVLALALGLSPSLAHPAEPPPGSTTAPSPEPTPTATPTPEPTPTATPTPEPAPTAPHTPTPTPTVTPTPEPTPTATPSPTPSATAELQPQTARPAHDRFLRFEVSVSSEVLFFASSTPDATTDNDIGFMPSVRVGLGLTEHLVLSLGWRPIADMSRADLGYELTTSGDAALVTARYELPLTGALAVAAELDLELSHLDYQLAVGRLSGSTDSWGFGAIPRLVFISRADLEALALDFRAFVGFALRTSHRADELRLGSGSDEIAPLDLGTLDLNGLTLGATFALSF